MEQVCEHIRRITSIKEPKDYVCEECIKTGDSWMHLRTCQTCGVTLCCDSSPNRHMSKHSRQKNIRWQFLPSRVKDGCGVIKMRLLQVIEKQVVRGEWSIEYLCKTVN